MLSQLSYAPVRASSVAHLSDVVHYTQNGSVCQALFSIFYFEFSNCYFQELFADFRNTGKNLMRNPVWNSKKQFHGGVFSIDAFGRPEAFWKKCNPVDKSTWQMDIFLLPYQHNFRTEMRLSRKSSCVINVRELPDGARQSFHHVWSSFCEQCAEP